MHEQVSIEDAIDNAKVSLAPGSNEPAVPTTCVLFRELIHALEILWDYSEHELNEGLDPKAHQTLADALSSGEIISRQYEPNQPPEHCPIISRSAWPSEIAKGFATPSRATFWHGVIRYEQDCKGKVGQLPFVLRSDAVNWLANTSGRLERRTQEERIRDLLEAAKGDEYSSAGDPVIPNDSVTIQNICDVAERMQGSAAERLSNEVVPEVYERVLSALIDQQLIARMLENDFVVPWFEWSPFRDKGVPAHKSGFTRGIIELMLHDDPRIREKTPVVPMQKAIEWLMRLDITRDQPEPEKFATLDGLLGWYRDVRFPEIQAMQPNDRPNADTVQKEITSRDAIAGGGEKRERARRIRRQVEPKGFFPVGRPARN